MFNYLSNRPRLIAFSFIFIFYLDFLVFPKTAGAFFVQNRVKIHSGTSQSSDWKGFFMKEMAKKPKIRLENNENKNKGLLNVNKDIIMDGGGPSQPEMLAFTSVNSANMVDLFSGDFSYNIPLMDVGGYPINLGYRAGGFMDEDASWVGFGWNVNPGTITRNLRGLPDDFDGKYDSITKIQSIKENKTVGINLGAGLEILGFPKNLSPNLGIFHNTYKGWGLEYGLSASINSGNAAKGPLTGNLSFSNNSQEGVSISPSFSIKIAESDNIQKGYSLTGGIASSYNSRYGIKGLNFSTGLRYYENSSTNQRLSTGSNFRSSISFSGPTFTPNISLPYSSLQYSFSGKLGLENTGIVKSVVLSGYVSSQKIAQVDTVLSLPSYGYLNYHKADNNLSALMDFNYEKDIPYNEKPPVPQIGMPIYTYDAFSITGEGIGGMFRGYRGDVGAVYDHFMRTKDESGSASIDIAPGNIFHAGVDITMNRAFSQTSKWVASNPLSEILGFKDSYGLYEASYFRNPAEKAINDNNFYEGLGGDDLAAIKLFQTSPANASISTTNYLNLYKNKKKYDEILLTPESVYKKTRDKRMQNIQYLIASDAQYAAHSKYIEYYEQNNFQIESCEKPEILSHIGGGLRGEYFQNTELEGQPHTIRIDPEVNITESNLPLQPDNYSIRWTGSLLAPETGSYHFSVEHDNGIRLWINDSLIVNRWAIQTPYISNFQLNLLEGEYYKIRIEFYEKTYESYIHFKWKKPATSVFEIVPSSQLFYKIADASFLSPNKVIENRINNFRKPNHISEISVLNTDGRKYVYGIPVYNLKQKEVTFSVNSDNSEPSSGLVSYSHGLDNTTGNEHGRESYLSIEETPSYAHSFLLTSILSSDYVDITGNGISEDDIGDGIQFKYSKIYGAENPFKWRTPYKKDYATHNLNLKTDLKDDKGSYVYGEKELWYLHSIESKTMIATFTLENRLDLISIDEQGKKEANRFAKRLKEINLYAKADYLKNGSAATPVKTVHFAYSYDLASGSNGNSFGKLTLDSVYFTYNGNPKVAENPYVFFYGNNKPHQFKAYDSWGNYKDTIHNPKDPDNRYIQNDDFPYVIQDSIISSENASAWALDSILLPSGGALKIVYESDDYAFVQNKRAMNLTKIAGFGNSPTDILNDFLYSQTDNLFVFIELENPAQTATEFYDLYLKDIEKLYFKIRVKMPFNIGGGYEYISGYSEIDETSPYGLVNEDMAWIKLKGINKKGDDNGNLNPMSVAALQFLRLNLPAQAYPGSEVADNLGPRQMISLVAGLALNSMNTFRSFETISKEMNRVNYVDLNNSFVRLNNPNFKKFGGGHRVKKILVYDHWDKMTGNRGIVYGQEYQYTDEIFINGNSKTISSGVASFEPGLGGDENPFRTPVEYIDKSSVLGPVNLLYVEEPVAESLYPSPSVGYSKVKVRTINYKNIKSANGYEVTRFFTTYDFPTFSERTLIGPDSKKRFRPSLSNFLRINARHHVALSQGFKIELNDMNGKMRSHAIYGENSEDQYLTYTENFYKIENQQSGYKKLSNIVSAIHPDGSIDSISSIGKDLEIMVSMREQLSVTTGGSLNLNGDLFAVGIIPAFIPSALMIRQREENLYRAVSLLKVINRYGILDSIVHIDKGSKISTKNILFDSETGEVALSRTQNEFGDPIYNFNYSGHWAYDGMKPAYNNLNAIFHGVSIIDGAITGGMSEEDKFALTAGDELLIYGKVQTGEGNDCEDIPFSTFPSVNKAWVVDRSHTEGGERMIFLVTKEGAPYNGNDVSLMITRSGHRNIMASVGSVTSLANPLKFSPETGYYLLFDENTKVINSSAVSFKDYWKVDDIFKARSNEVCEDTLQFRPIEENCDCILPVLNYLITSKQLFIKQSDSITIGSLINNASIAGFGIDTSECSYMLKDTSQLFYALTQDSIGNQYNAKFGNCEIMLYKHSIYSKMAEAPLPASVNFNQLLPGTCDPAGNPSFISLTYDTCYNFLFKPSYAPYDPDDPDDPNRIYSFSYFDCSGNFYQENGTYTNNPPSIIDAGCGQTPFALNMNIDTAGICMIKTDTLYVGFSMYNCYSCIPDTLISCYSTVTDTTLNPYTTGILGNWRPDKSYLFYGERNAAELQTKTDIRVDGAIKDYESFWKFQDGKLLIDADTTKWIWNSQVNMFNRKGLEIENKDPLGRYNAGLYGYNLSLPVAVIQNSRYRESAFDGFEDYLMNLNNCDTLCRSEKHFDFDGFKDLLSTEESHTGNYSLKLTSDASAGLNFTLTTTEDDISGESINYSLQNIECFQEGQVLEKISTNNQALISKFSPLKGMKMLISAWVKEGVDCQCDDYINNNIVVSFTGASKIYNLSPTGNIIEGWQRYENVFEIPETATSMNLVLNSLNNATVYFDDIRIHPFNANMKSFVFDPVSLRLVAELDENNYATFYEYDDDGTLIRIKKETKSGIKTIQETRSSLIKTLIN